MTLGADFALPYQAKTRAAAGTRDATLATNAYSRFLAQQRGSRSLVDINKNMTRGMEGLASSYGRRGMGYSGAFSRGQSDYGESWTQQNNDVNDGIAQAMRQADLGDAGAYTQYDSTVADVEAQKAAQIQADAAHLDNFRPFL